MSAVTPYVIRAAEIADLSCLAEIERAADTLFPEGRLPADDATYPLDGLKTALEKQLLLIAENADALLGHCLECPFLQQTGFSDPAARRAEPDAEVDPVARSRRRHAIEGCHVS